MRNNLIFSLLLLAFSAAGQGAGGFFGLLAGRDSGPAFEAEYVELLEYWDSLGYDLPSAGLQAKQNTLLAAMKTGGAWDRLEVIYVFASGTDTASDSLRALTNWKAPGTYTGVPFGAVLFESFGIRTAQSAGINSNFSSSLGAGTSRNNISITAWVNSFWDATGRNLSAGNVASLVQSLIAKNDIDLRINSNTINASSSLAGVMDSDKFYSASRTASLEIKYRNATTRQEVAGASSLTNLGATISVGASTANTEHAKGTFSFFSVGQEIDDEAPALYTALLTYINSL